MRKKTQPELIRYNVVPMVAGADPSWEFQAAPDGRFLFADSVLERIAALEAENTRLKAPVTDEEWEKICRHDEDGFEFINRIDLAQWLASRAAIKEGR